MSQLLILCVLFLSLSAQASVQSRIVGGQESVPNAWPFMSALMFKYAGVTTENNASYRAFFMQGAPNEELTGTLGDCGLAFSPCENVDGKICLIERGTSFFTDKIANCEAGGGLAAVIYNNIEGPFLGQAEATIPAVSISRDSGLALLNNLEENITLGYLDDTPIFSFCGGSYLGDKWVITAAHCVQDVKAPSIVLNIGGQNLETDQDNIINVVNVYVHKGYDDISLQNDIALIELETAPQNVSPIFIADKSILDEAIVNNATVTTIGRGLKTALDSISEPAPEFPDPELYEVDLALTSNETCNPIMNGLISDDMICAGDLNGGVGSCKGDSGGPLILQRSGKSYLVGLTSWGYGCAQANTYGVYNRPTYFMDIISIVMNKRSQSVFVSTTPTKSGALDNVSILVFVLLLFMFRFIKRYAVKH